MSLTWYIDKVEECGGFCVLCGSANGYNVGVGAEEHLFKVFGDILFNQYNYPTWHGAIILVNGGHVFVRDRVCEAFLLPSVGTLGTVFGCPATRTLYPGMAFANHAVSSTAVLVSSSARIWYCFEVLAKYLLLM